MSIYLFGRSSEMLTQWIDQADDWNDSVDIQMEVPIQVFDALQIKSIFFIKIKRQMIFIKLNVGRKF